ncbi:protein phosphatase inhibitor protein [Besnoitia besnoiti]|uniref:Protein phosphatase inhibitor protein n=1 Tax=Besnoitia besnoiti TaxID=94643 RepID=A0A2A9MI65_BESBE|nr:protein phosphatase inhibitor protein [Besnoitia besnoiti]PFH35090.1 protein phosphatase inhibitor protein [Besnoitia besnoiti]
MAARGSEGSSGSATTTVSPPAVVHIIAENREASSQGSGDSTVVPLAERRVSWDAHTVDNENMHKKKSKKCCIFHKQRPFGESSSESDTDSDDDKPHASKKERRHEAHCPHRDQQNTPTPDDRKPVTPGNAS